MVSAPIVRISRPVRPLCCAEASSSTPTSRPGFGRSPYRWPPIETRPVLAGVRPTMMRIVVDLPAPFGPRKPVTRPGRATNDTSSTAVWPPYVLVTPSTVIMRRVSSAATRPHIGPRDRAPRPKEGVGRDSGICSAASAARRVRRVQRPDPGSVQPATDLAGAAVAHHARRSRSAACCGRFSAPGPVGAGPVAVLARPVLRPGGPGADLLPATLAVRGRGAHQRPGLRSP